MCSLEDMYANLGHMYSLEYAMYAALGTCVQPCGYFTCAASSFFLVSPSQCVRPVLLLSDSDSGQCSGGWRGLMGKAGHARRTHYLSGLGKQACELELAVLGGIITKLLFSLG